jgi:hypothetical protein
MKIIFLIAGVLTLLTCTGCFFPGRGGGWHDRRGEIAVPPAGVELATPEIIESPLVSIVW